MDVMDDLARARATFEQGDWATAFQAWTSAGAEQLDVEDLGRLGTTAWLTGHDADSVAALQRAFQLHLDRDRTAGAVRCAFWLARVFVAQGEQALSNGWRARAQRLLEDVDQDTVEHGYVELLAMLHAVEEQDWETAARCAVVVHDYGRRFGDPDLRYLGLAARGRLVLASGSVSEGLAMFDEAMVGVAAGELSPVFAGQVYCLMIEACQEVSDLGRAADWTAALSRWCTDQPGLVPFTGQCAVHRGQIMRLHGAYREALEEYDRAVTRYLASSYPAAAGLAHAERGDVLRLIGDLDGAEQSYSQAAELGHDAQPGTALLWLLRGRTRAALGAGRRMLAEAPGPVQRARLLPAAIEILLAAGEREEAEERLVELERIAHDFGCTALQAAGAQARGRTELDGGDAAGSLPYLRKAVTLWSGLDAPYDVARCRTLIGRALEVLGDRETARSELAAARRAFEGLGAPADVAALGPNNGTDQLPGGLTAREVEVLRLVAAGRSNAEIASSLVLSEKTVARHLSNIFGKLDVASRTAAAAFAFEHDLL